MNSSAVIVDIVRTACGKGKPGGALVDVHPADLLGQTLRSLVERNGIDAGQIDDVIAGCTAQVGDQALNIGRTALLSAGFPESVPAVTIDRQCGSGQQAADFAAQTIMAGVCDIVVACGVDSMSRVPLGMNQGGGSAFDPLLNRYPSGIVHQGVSAELVAARWKISREDMDEFATESHRRATLAANEGAFDNEIIEISSTGADGSTHIHRSDELIRPNTTVEALAGLEPRFVDDEIGRTFPEINWSVTAGNSSPLTDGASAALIMSESAAEKLGLKPRARFHTFAVVGADPVEMLSAVIPATRKALDRAGLSLDEIDAYEVNEAFASVPLAWQREFNTDPKLLNPRGGAIAIGHPLGGSGLRLMSTMVNYLESTGGRYGLQTMCEGGGMANATIIERL